MIAALPVNIRSKRFLPCDNISNASILQTNKQKNPTTYTQKQPPSSGQRIFHYSLSSTANLMHNLCPKNQFSVVNGRKLPTIHLVSLFYFQSIQMVKTAEMFQTSRRNTFLFFRDSNSIKLSLCSTSSAFLNVFTLGYCFLPPASSENPLRQLKADRIGNNIKKEKECVRRI